MSKPSTVPLTNSHRRRLVAMRDNLGWTQQQLADELRAHRVTVARIEAGISSPSQELLEKWCALVGLDVTVETVVTLKKAKKISRA